MPTVPQDIPDSRRKVYDAADAMIVEDRAATGATLGRDVPDQARAVRVRHASQRLLVAEDFADQHLDEIERETAKADFQKSTWLSGSPGVRAWFEGSPYRYGFVKPDLAHWEKVSRVLERPRHLWPASPDEVLKKAEARVERRLGAGPSLSEVGEAELEAELVEVGGRFVRRPPAIKATAQSRQRLIEDERARLQAFEDYVSGEEPIGVWQAFARRAEENPLFLLAFLGGANDAERILSVYKAAKAVEAKTDTDDDRETLVEFARLAEASERRGHTFWGSVTGVAQEIPAIASEFFVTGGAFTLGRKGFQSLIKVAAEKTLKARALGAVRAVGGALVGGAVQTAAMAPIRMVGGTAERMTPKFALSLDEQGKLAPIITGPAEDTFLPALLKSAGERFVEALSERAGQPIGALLGKWKASIASRWLRLNPDKGVSGLLSKVSSATGWHGVVGEVFEERVGEVGRAALGIEDYRPPTASELEVEIAAFAVPGAAALPLRLATLKRQRAEQHAVQWKSIVESVGETAGRQVSPEQAAEVIREVARGSGNDTVWVDARKWDEHWRGRKDDAGRPMDPEREYVQAVGVGGLAASYSDTLAADGVLSLPVEQAALLATTDEGAKFFQDEIKPGPTEPTLAEADDEFKKVQAAEKVSHAAEEKALKSVAAREPEIRKAAVLRQRTEAEEELRVLEEEDVIAQVERASTSGRIWWADPNDPEKNAEELRKSDVPRRLMALPGDRGARAIDDVAAELGMSDQELVVALERAAKARENVKVKAALEEPEEEAMAVEAELAFKRALDTELGREPVAGPSPDEQAETIGKSVQRRVRAAGRPAEEARVAGKLYQAFYKAMGERVGVSPQELFQRRPVRIAGAAKGASGFEQPGVVGEPKLSAIHQLTPENLKFSDEMGGISVPSIAVLPEGIPLKGYGDITLIGRKAMGDPSVVPVFDADAYSPTFPKPEYKKVSTKAAQAVVDELSPFAKSFDDRGVTDTLWDYSVNRPDPQRVIETLVRSVGARAWFLSEKGAPVEPITEVVTEENLEAPFVASPAFKAFSDKINGKFHQLHPTDDPAGWADYSKAVSTAIDEYTKKIDAEDLAESYKNTYLDENGLLLFGLTIRINRSREVLGTTRVASGESIKKVDDKIKGREEEFKAWLEAKILPMYGEPSLTVKRKKVPYTLENIVEAMVGRVRGREETITFGEGAARASVAKRFRTLEEMRKAATEIASESEISVARERAQKLMSDYRDAVLNYSTIPSPIRAGQIDVWEALDSSMRAVAKWVKTGRRGAEGMRRALLSERFKDVPEDVIEKAMEAANAWLTAPVPYFEAKPQRSVLLSEFAGAVIPESASEATKEVLNRNQIPYRTYAKDQERIGVLDAFRRELVEKGEEVLFQPGEAGPRGFFDPIKNLIALLPKANVSTFLHETGHYWLELLGDLAGVEGTPDAVKADFQTALDFIGIKDRATWGAMSIEERKEAHEKFAKSFESYLKEGRAPSKGLRAVFATLRRWLSRLYRALGLGVELTPEVRAMMDRLLATDDELAEAKYDEKIAPLFSAETVEQLEAIGIKGERAVQYAAALADYERQATEHLTKKMMAALAREERAEWKAEKDEVRKEVEKELDARPDYIAYANMVEGRHPDGSELLASETRIKLRTSEAKDYGDDLFAKLPTEMLSEEEGLPIDVAASLFGFSDAAAFMTAIANLEFKVAAAERIARERMEERHPDEMDDPEARREEAVNALHEEGRSKVLRLEMELLASEDFPKLKAIVRRLRIKMPADAEMKDEARAAIGRLPAGAVRPGGYQAAARRASRAAMEAFLKGDLAETARQKMLELSNHERYRAAVEAKEGVEKSLERFRDFFKTDESIAKSRDIDIVNAGRAVLAAFGIGFAEKPPDSYLESLKEYDAQRYEVVSNRIAETVGNANPWRESSYADFAFMRDTVMGLWQQALDERHVELEGKKVALDDLRSRLGQRARELGQGLAKIGYQRRATLWERTKLKILGVKAAFRRVESWADAMDPKEAEGERKLVTRSLVTPIMEATANYRLAKGEGFKRLRKSADLLSAVTSGADIAAPELGYTFDGTAELVGAILHGGNDSNLEKLLVGRGWGRMRDDGTLDRSRWDAFRERGIREGFITKEMYDFAQAVWDQFEEMKPDAQRVHKAEYGWYFDEITARQVTTPWGDYRGGYVAAMADPMMVTRANEREQQAILRAQNSSFMFPSTGKGFTKSRIREYRVPLLMNTNMLITQLDNVLRFVHLQPAVRQTGKIVFRGDFREAMEGLDPSAISDMILPWLQRVALQRVYTPSVSKGVRFFDPLLNAARRRVAQKFMILNVTNALQNVTGEALAAIKVSPKHLVSAHLEWIRDPRGFTKTINDKSKFMLTNTSTQMDDAAFHMERVLQPNSYRKVDEWITDHAYILQRLTQNPLSKIVWSAGYNEAVENGLPESEAIRDADAVVRLTQGAFGPESISRIEAGTPFVRLLLMFTGWYNMKANLLGTETAKALRQEEGLKREYGRLLYAWGMGFAIPAVLGGLIWRLMAGKGAPPDDDDEETPTAIAWAKFGLNEMGKDAAAMTAVGAPVYRFVERLAGKRPDAASLDISPVFSAMEEAGRGAATIVGAMEAERNRGRAVQDTLTLIQLMTGLPLVPAGRATRFAYDVEEGRKEPVTTADYIRGIITGR